MSRIRPLFAALSLVGIAACSKPYEGPYKHVLLISLDTLRADHLGCYGAEVSTPNIDRIAEVGTVFESAMAPAPTTLASHTSMMTGTYTHTHGVVRNGFMVHQDNVMLAEVLQENGFHTAGFLGSFALESRFDFDQGFQWFDERFDIAVDIQNYDQFQRRGEVVTDVVLDYVDRPDVKKQDRLFLFAHYFDVHTPYNPPAPYNTQYGAQVETSTMEDVGKMVRRHESQLGWKRDANARHGLGLPRAMVERATGEPLAGTFKNGRQIRDEDLAALYAGEVSYLDHHLGRLFDGLRQRGILEDTLIVITADHGETFWEHADFWNHGLWCYETTVHVPLIVSVPTGEGAGKRVAMPVSGTDVMPTILDVLDIEIPSRVEGMSLRPLVNGEPMERGPVFSMATQPFRDYRPDGSGGWPNLPNPRCVRIGDYKYILAPYADGLQELYDLASDPGERTNLIGAPGTDASRVASLRGALTAWVDSAEPLASRFNPEQIQAVKRALAGLGYTGDDSEDCNRNGIPDAEEIQDGRARDANGDGVPDDCQ